MATEFEIIDVTPRDGLQNEPVIFSIEEKLQLISRSIETGISRIEVASFVNPKKVPQMANPEELLNELSIKKRASYSGLVLNERGFSRALDSECDEITFVIVASDEFSLKNQGMTTAQSIDYISELLKNKEKGIKVCISIAAAFGCPFEGEVKPSRVIEIAEKCLDLRPDEISLADTIGVAVPKDIKQKVEPLISLYPNTPVRLHLHNTRNTAISNAWTAFELGVKRFDASFGGIGGCPFAPNATGNVAIEDLVYLFERSGFDTGVDLDASIKVAEWLRGQVKHPLPSALLAAGDFKI